MQYSISFNQKAAVDSKLPLDVIDLSILAFIKDFTHTGNCNHVNFGGKSYYWISHKLIIDNMPCLGITSKSGIFKRVKKLCELKVLTAHPDNQILSSSYYTFGDNYSALFFSTSTEQKNDLSPTPESMHPTPEKPKGYSRKGIAPTPEKVEYYKYYLDNGNKEQTIKVPSDFLKSSEAEKERYLIFQRQIEEEYQKVYQLEPISIKILTNCCVIYGKETVMDKIGAMENCADLLKKYSSAGLTLKTWLKRELTLEQKRAQKKG